MHTQNLDQWTSSHNFLIEHQAGEKKSRIVLAITALTMVVEIVGGTLFGSMALLADGWHMMTHVAAFAITLFAYAYARKNRDNPDFSFSTGKVSSLGGFASAIALGVVALMMGMESIERLFTPTEIHFNQAIFVAIIGLIVNGVSVFLLHDHHGHEHEHKHGEHDHHHEHDHNLAAAYFHVLADTLTSILAIGALIIGKWLGWKWPDPVMGIVGALIITKWAIALLKQSSRILLDRSASADLREKVRAMIESDHDNRVADLHIWNVSETHRAVVLSLVTHAPQDPAYYKKLLNNVDAFAHVSIEVNPATP
jgi:cation diffusion facilitator family transporter